MPAFHETMYKPPKEPIYYNFRTYLKAQKNFITQYYEHIEFPPAHLIRDINGDVKDQTIRDKNGDEREIGYNYETMRLYDELQHQDFRERKLYLATDGVAAARKESLGFLMTDDKGNPFIRCYRQPAGMNPQSFRSEICAALAALK